MSIEGGVEKAVERAASVSASCLQVFTASNSRWQGKFPGENSILLFKARRDEHGISAIVSHNSYLHNLGSPDAGLYEKSIAGLFEEIKRCEALEIPFIVIHPGAATDGNRDAGLRRIGNAVKKLLKGTRESGTTICFEITAGQGTALGSSFEELGLLLEYAAAPERTGICFDTCHLFAAGIDFVTRLAYKKMFEGFNQRIGTRYLKVIHFNDSKYPFGSRRDRHEHIGKGYIGCEPFGFFLNDAAISHVPKILETHKGKDLKEDVMNLATLRSLCSLFHKNANDS